ncbi:MAG: hypothetical protein MRY49_01760 [Candidatus Pacebacteria bacterium]|nr:hypothetical protein [Candidatus Paceibacterota bacterium]
MKDFFKESLTAIVFSALILAAAIYAGFRILLGYEFEGVVKKKKSQAAEYMCYRCYRVGFFSICCYCDGETERIFEPKELQKIPQH